MTTKTTVLAIAATALASAAAGFLVQRSLQGGGRVEGARSFEIRSAVLGEARGFTVQLPQSYDASHATGYPVLYVLDGGFQAEHTAESAALLARIGVIPPTIVVGIPNDDETRGRDYTTPGTWTDADAGGAGRFLAFLRTELIPRIETEYGTARPRMLTGWSRSGHFVLWSQIADPSLFDGRFAHSPFVWSEEDDRVVTQFDAGFAAAAPAAGFLYLSLGDEETLTMSVFRRAAGVLESKAPPALQWRADVSAGGDHETNVRSSAPVALCAMFAQSTGQACRPARTSASVLRQ